MSSESFLKDVEQARKALDERLVGKHIRTLACLQVKSAENDSLRHRVSELEGYKRKADYYGALEQQIQFLQDELSKCSKLHKWGRNAEEKINEIKEEFSKAFRDYQGDIEEKYKNEVKSYISEKEENASVWQEEKAKMEGQIKVLRASNKTLQKKLEAAATMEKNMNNLANELDATVLSFQETKARNEELQQSNEGLEEYCKALEEENMSLQEELENSSSDQRKLKKEMNKMVMKITKYIRQIKELERVKNTVSRLEFENSWVKHLHEKSVLELKSLKMKHKDALNELQIVTQERNLLRNELSSVRQEVIKLKDELENSRHSFNDFLELKRQVGILREENRSLLKKSKTYKIKVLKPDTMDSQKQLLQVQNLKAR